MLPDGDPRHGTRHGYRDDGCKCDLCKKAIALNHNLYKMRRAANAGRPLLIPKLGAVRRLQSLMAFGWPRRELSREAGYKGDAFSPILYGKRTHLTIESHNRISDLFERLCMTPGPSPSARIRAQKEGWPVPLAWPDDRLDDPNYTPSDWHYTATDRGQAIRDMADMGFGITEASRRLHLSRDAIERWCSRHGMADVYRQLAAREALRENQYTREGVA